MTTFSLSQGASDLIARVEPTLRRTAAVSETERRLAPEAVSVLRDAGLFRTWAPRALGGLEMEPVEALRLFEELARIDSAAGWTVGNSSSIALICQALSDEGATEIYARPDTLVGGALNPPAAAVPFEGGYRVTGQWPFGSASEYADWLMGLCVVMEGEAPRMNEAGQPVAAIVFFPKAEAEILDTWHTLGMRGTGSNDIRVTDVFVPERRVFLLGPLDRPGSAYRGPLYRTGVWLIAPQIAMVALGVARAALDDLIALAESKTPSYTQTALADRSLVQDRVARARAQIDAARSYVLSAAADAWEFVQGGQRITAQEGAPLALAGTFGVEAAVQAVGLVHAMAGTSAIRNEHRFQQYFRDVNTISQHAFASASRYESIGRLLLGRASDWAFYYV